jgi:hypothetical protein
MPKVNSELTYLLRRLRLAVISSSPVIARKARQAVKGAPPKLGEPYRPMRQLAMEHEQVVSRPAYYTSITVLAGLLAALFVGLALACGRFDWPAGYGLHAAAVLMAAAIIAAFQCLFANHGPEVVLPQRWHLAEGRLADSGDLHHRPAGLLAQLLLLAILCVDGFFCGAAVSQLFAVWLTPAMAVGASVAWGVAVAAMLWKFVQAAARESLLAERRLTIRALDMSDRAGDHQLAGRMKDRLGVALGADYSDRRGPYPRRVALLTSVLLLGTAIYALRTTGVESSSTKAALVPVEHASGMGTADEATLAAAPVDVGESTREDRHQRIGSAVMALFFVLSVTAAYGFFRARTSLGAHSAGDHAVLARFDSVDELIAHHTDHVRRWTAIADVRLTKLADAIERRKVKLAPHVQKTYPPAHESFVDIVHGRQSRLPLPQVVVDERVL